MERKFSEREFVRRLAELARRHATPTVGGLALKRGIGDDCAVLAGAGRHDLLVTSDLVLEDVHFRRFWQGAAAVGHKVLARGLSDIAAMGGVPRYAFLSLALPASVNWRWVQGFFRGLFRLAKSCGVTLAGGDTSASRSGIVADIMVVGEVPAGQAVLRSGAQPGDAIWISGQLGGAAAALKWLLRKKAAFPSRRSALLRPLLYPQPRLAIGRALRQRGLTSAMLDVSDGLSIDLARLCEASGVGARVVAEAIPHPRNATWEEMLHGGEDFELLFTVPRRLSRKVPRRIGGVPLTRIGEITSSRRLRLLRQGTEEPLPVRGFEHF